MPTARPATPPTAPALTMPAAFDVDDVVEDADAVPLRDTMEVTAEVLIPPSNIVELPAEVDGATGTAVDEEGTLG